MGIGVGGGIGPVRAGVGLSDRELGGFVAWLLGIAAVILLVLLAVLVLPVVGLAVAAVLASRSRIVSALVVGTMSVALAAVIWSYAYTFLRFTEAVPKVTGAHYDVERATDELAYAGFNVVRVDQQGTESGAFCSIDSTEPPARAKADTREVVVINRLCSPPAE